MNNFLIKKEYFNWIKKVAGAFSPQVWIVLFAFMLAVISTAYSFRHGYIVAYGDAESHLNIAKRVIDSLTPGFAQLGGIWLPLPHLLLVPFVQFDFLWRTGLAGSIVSGVCFIVSAVYLYKLTLLITKNKPASFFAALIFITNPNILYMQSTPMSELTLIVFFILSSYYFIKFLQYKEKVMYLISAALFGFCASLSRYDGWALVLMEAGVLLLAFFPYRLSWKKIKALRMSSSEEEVQEVITLNKHGDDTPITLWKRLEGYLVLFSTLSFFGILLWLVWGALILGDPLYFTHSQFSANSQQHSWLGKGELPSYHNIISAFLYYFFTSLSNSGVLIFIMAIIGLVIFLIHKENKNRIYILLILSVPFLFNVLTLFLGQSVIFIPSLTPISYEWTLFNVRYGVMMIPCVAICLGYLFYISKNPGKILISALCVCQIGLYLVGFSHVISLQDGTIGLSSGSSHLPDAQLYIAAHYDYGDVLVDDFARTLSIIRTNIPMQNIIYVGNKPYWSESLAQPEKYARWIIMQKDDSIWNAIYDDPQKQGELFKYFNKVYTSDNILIFRRINDVAVTAPQP